MFITATMRGKSLGKRIKSDGCLVRIPAERDRRFHFIVTDFFQFCGIGDYDDGDPGRAIEDTHRLVWDIIHKKPSGEQRLLYR